GHEGQLTSVAFSPDGKRLASCDEYLGEQHRSSLRVWNVETGVCEAIVPLHSWGKGVAFSPSGDQVAVTGMRGLLAIVDLQASSVRHGQTAGDSYCVDWRQADRLLLSGGGGDKLTMVGAGNLVPITSFSAPSGPGEKAPQADCARYSPDGKWIAAIDTD